MLIQNCLFVSLLLTINEMTKLPKLVPYWHVPGFDAKFEEIEILGFERREHEVGDLREEAARMHAQFGQVSETGQPYFELAYGSGNVGLQKLKDLIQAHAKVDESDIKLSRDVELELEESINFDDPDADDDGADNADALAAANAAADAAQAEADALRDQLAKLQAEKDAVAPQGEPAKEPSGDGAGNVVDPLKDDGKAKPKAKG